MKANDLRGDALQVFESWRALGYSEFEALQEVERSGVVIEEQLFEIFTSIGLSESVARIAARGRAGQTTTGDPLEEVVQLFRTLGLSESAARVAAIGRGISEPEARWAYAEAARSPAPPTAPQATDPDPPSVKRYWALREAGASTEDAQAQVLRELREGRVW
ncbi:hypothetical protein GCM10010517_36580 [Streptosporangium fragile]|uniref:Uncharacterized protein n=1 Tax=Streptosporangium fragile TaxID=46186 RepID=A0ABP6IEF9_9ACTN